MLWIYLSKHLDALELKIADFVSKAPEEELLHLKRPSFEAVQNQLTQVALFKEYTYFIFEEYSGSFSEIERLFERVEITSNVLITKSIEGKVHLPGSLLSRLEDKNFFLYLPSFRAKEGYLNHLLEKQGLTLPENLLSIMRREALFSCIQIRGVVDQLKILSSSVPFSEKLVREVISSNKIVDYLDDRHLFFQWYVTNQFLNGYSFLTKLVFFRTALIEFLRYFGGALNYNFWNTYHSEETLEYIQELGYNFFLFMEEKIFKIKKDSAWPIIHFFWENRPSRTLYWHTFH